MSHLVRSCTLASIVLLILKGTHGKIIVSPSNAVSELNGQVTFQCEGDQFQGTWYISKNGVGSSQEVLIVRPSCVLTPGFEAHYAVDTTGKPNVCNLIVANITMEQAGVYKCDEQDLVYALLTVTVMSPTVTYNKTLDVVAENDDVIITCSLDHNGSVAPASTLRPYFYWTNFNGENESISYSLTTENTAVSKITVRAGRQNITSFSCHAYLELHVNQSNNAGYATNTPPFSKNASSPNIEVLYGPSIPKLTPKPDVITVNEVSCGISVLTCSSNGNPAPNYRWHDSAENGILSTTNNLTLAEINRNYRCEAYNTIRNDVHNESATHTISQNDCTSTGKCCVFPRDEMTSVTVKGCDNGTSCDCLRGYGEITLTCNAKTFPNASYVWSGPYGHVTNSSVYNVIMNGDHRCIAYFNKTLSNYTGDVTFPNGTNETNVQECSSPETSSTLITHLTSTTTPACNDTDCPDANKTGTGIDVGVIIGIVIGVIVILNVVATCLFFWYYKRGKVSDSGKKERNNKLRLDRRFPWLKKMMPCVSDTKESAGSNCLWVSLFILLGIVTGIVTFPIWILLANKYENNETSALNKRENGDGNGSGENGRRPTNISSANHNQPPSTNQMNAIRQEGPYQNESSRENIEMNNSLRSRNLLLPGSPPSRPPPAGRPPPPPNKPTMSLSNSRSKDYTINDQQTQAANPEHTTYADLPFVPRNTLPTANPVQFLNVSNDTYASLNKT